MSKTFKIYKHPLSSASINNDNTFFVDSINGSDNNVGTREMPFKTTNKASSKTYIVLRGNFNEIISSRAIIGEGNKISIYTNANYSGDIYNCIIDQYSAVYGAGNSITVGCIIKLFEEINSYTHVHVVKNNLIYNLNFCYSGINTFKCNTIVNLLNYVQFTLANILLDSIIVNSFELYNPRSTDVSKTPNFKYCLFLKDVQYKWKNTVIPINYGDNPANWIADLKTSLTAFAETLPQDAERTYLEAMIANSFDSTNRIYDDSGKTLFCKYDSNGEIVDYSLSKDCGFPLNMSSQGGYVGAYYVGLPSPELTGIYDVDENGNNTTNTPDLLLHDNGTFTSNINSTQFHNRAEFEIEHFPRGFSFDGFQSHFITGLANRVYIGKKQVLDQDNLPIETIEIIPYDNPTTPSATYPKFSAELNGRTEMFYLVSENRPLLFNDLASIGIETDKDLNLYGNWGVTTADYESYLLHNLNTVTVKKILIYYFKKEINIHYAAE